MTLCPGSGAAAAGGGARAGRAAAEQRPRGSSWQRGARRSSPRPPPPQLGTGSSPGAPPASGFRGAGPDGEEGAGLWRSLWRRDWPGRETWGCAVSRSSGVRRMEPGLAVGKGQSSVTCLTGARRRKHGRGSLGGRPRGSASAFGFLVSSSFGRDPFGPWLR